MAVSRFSFLVVLVFSISLLDTAFCMRLKREAEPESDETTTEGGGDEEPTTEDGGSEEPTTEDGGSEEPTTEDGGSEEPTTEDEGSEEPTTEGDGGDGGSTDKPDDSEEAELQDNSLSANDDYDSISSSNESSSPKGEDNSTSADPNSTNISTALDVDNGQFPFQGGFIFDSPFFNLEQVERYFRKLERAMENIFQQAMDEFGNNGTNFKNSSDELVVVDGQKYNVHTTVIKGGDANDSISIEAISVVPMDKRRKRSLW